MSPDDSTVNKELSAVWTHSRVYTLAAVLHRAAGFILIPVYAHVLPAAEFGAYAMIVMLSDIIAVAFGTGISTGMLRVYFDYDTSEDRNRVVSTAFIALGVAGLGITVLLQPLAVISSHALFGSNEYGGLFSLAYAGVVFALLGDLGLHYFRMQEKSWIVLYASCAKVILFLTLNILFVVVLGMGVRGILLGTLISSTVLAAALLLTIVPRIGLSFSPAVLRSLLSFGLPLLPAVMADTVMDMTDKYFLNRLGSAASVGAYSLGNRVAALLHLFMSMPFATIWVVRRFERTRAASDHVDTAPIFTYFVIAITTAGLATAVMAPEIVHLVASAEYAAAAFVVPLLVVSYIVVALRMQLQLRIYQAKQTGLVAANAFVALAANIPLTYVLVGHFGLTGAAMAMVITNLLRAGGIAWLGKRYCELPLGFEWRRVSGVIGLAAITYLGVVLAVGVTVSVAAMAAKIAAVGLFLGLLVFARIVSPEERKTFAVLIRACLPPGLAR